MVSGVQKYWTGARGKQFLILLPGIREVGQLTTYQMCQIWMPTDWHSEQGGLIKSNCSWSYMSISRQAFFCLSSLKSILTSKIGTNRHNHKTNCSNLVVGRFLYILFSNYHQPDWKILKKNMHFLKQMLLGILNKIIKFGLQKVLV